MDVSEDLRPSWDADRNLPRADQRFSQSTSLCTLVRRAGRTLKATCGVNEALLALCCLSAQVSLLRRPLAGSTSATYYKNPAPAPASCLLLPAPTVKADDLPLRRLHPDSNLMKCDLVKKEIIYSFQ